MSLFVDVVPNPGIHVYAPGAKDYRPIAVTMNPQKSVIFADLKYPKSELMDFAGEQVPVYQTAFRLEERATVGTGPKTGSTLTLTASLMYQACDDRVCYIPETVPVHWAISVR